MKKHQVTIKDLAKILNVSPSTVSRALKDHPDISAETRKKVKALAQEMKYRPNTLARSLRESKSHVIGVVIPQIVHHFFSSVISGIESYASELGYSIIFSQSGESEKREKNNVDTLLAGRVDGIIISLTKETQDLKHIEKITELGIPLVFFDRAAEGMAADKVIIDDFAAAKIATEHLIENGGTNFLHFSGPESLDISIRRRDGFLHVLKKHKINSSEINVIKADNFEEGKQRMYELIQSGNIPDAIFTVNDHTAVGVLNALRNSNFRVPEDVLLVGFTNGFISTITSPQISSIEQNGFKIGSKAAELLVNRMEQEIDSGYITEVISSDLIIRGSSQKLKKS
ncbi:MAG: LacI family DNA-binding transcriptional regulator [Bacteroidota bacterium]|nr:LacI family DNA-binding transcriptional regulator [Bacteroidota bacterium]